MLRSKVCASHASLRRLLALHVSKLIMQILRKKVNRRHANQGLDIIDTAHAKLVAAIFDPESKDGVALEENFEARVYFRCLDVIRKERKYRDDLPLLAEDGGDFEIPAGDSGHCNGIGAIETAHMMAAISDVRKRLAFRLHMEDQHSVEDIAAVVRIDPTTLRKWIKEVQTFLKDKLATRQQL